MNNIMYTVLINGRKAYNQRFETYEKARQYARKMARQWIRKQDMYSGNCITPDFSQVNPKFCGIEVVKI